MLCTQLHSYNKCFLEQHFYCCPSHVTCLFYKFQLGNKTTISNPSLQQSKYHPLRAKGASPILHYAIPPPLICLTDKRGRGLWHNVKLDWPLCSVLYMTRWNVVLGLWPLATGHWVIHSTSGVIVLTVAQKGMKLYYSSIKSFNSWSTAVLHSIYSDDISWKILEFFDTYFMTQKTYNYVLNIYIPMFVNKGLETNFTWN